MYENMKLLDFRNRICGRKVAVMGFGVNNLELVKFLHEYGALVYVFDRATKDMLSDRIRDNKQYVEAFYLGDSYLSNLDGSFSYIFRTPGMRPDLPQISKAVSEGAILTSEMEVFLNMCPSHTIGITGSDGKTTTTTLIYTMLQTAGFNCYLGGNIGYPLLHRVEEMTPDDYIVLELSSFQLLNINVSTEISVITNISPNHLDMHKDYQEYIDSKKNIYANKDHGLVVLNRDNDVTRDIAEQLNADGKLDVRCFSKNPLTEGVYLDGDNIVYAGPKGSKTQIMSRSDIKLVGMHNVENYMTACAALMDIVPADIMLKVARTFGGVEHRLELVKNVNGIKFYNDSIATSPSRTIAALKSFDMPVILIAGGKEKGIPFDSLGEYLSTKVKVLVLVGATSKQIANALYDYIGDDADKHTPIVYFAVDYKDAVGFAYKCAESGDNIVLSPASTSYDMFKNFMERGRHFKQIVEELCNDSSRN